MNLQRREIKIATVFVVLGILLGSLVAYAATPSSTFWISTGVYPGAPSYTIWKEGSNYFAKDAYGEIEFSGTSEVEILQDAHDSLTTGGKILLMTASYTFDAPFNVTNYGIILEGEAHQGGEEPIARIIAGAAISDLIKVNITAIQGSFEIRNLCLDGASQGCNGLTLIRGLYHLVENVRILRCVKGLNIIGVGKSNFRNLRFEDNTYGIYLIDDGSPYPPNALSFERVDSIDNTEYGIYSNSSGAFTIGYLTFDTCLIESNHKWGGYFYNTIQCKFDHCLFESNNKDAVASIDDLHIEYATERNAFVSVEDCNFIGTDVTHSLNIFGADHVKIERTYFNDNVTLDYCKYGSVEINEFVVSPTITGNVLNFTFVQNQGYP